MMLDLGGTYQKLNSYHLLLLNAPSLRSLKRVVEDVVTTGRPEVVLIDSKPLEWCLGLRCRFVSTPQNGFLLTVDILNLPWLTDAFTRMAYDPAHQDFLDDLDLEPGFESLDPGMTNMVFKRIK